MRIENEQLLIEVKDLLTKLHGGCNNLSIEEQQTVKDSIITAGIKIDIVIQAEVTP